MTARGWHFAAHPWRSRGRWRSGCSLLPTRPCSAKSRASFSCSSTSRRRSTALVSASHSPSSRALKCSMFNLSQHAGPSSDHPSWLRGDASNRARIGSTHGHTTQMRRDKPFQLCRSCRLHRAPRQAQVSNRIFSRPVIAMVVPSRVWAEPSSSGLRIASFESPAACIFRRRRLPLSQSSGAPQIMQQLDSRTTSEVASEGSPRRWVPIRSTSVGSGASSQMTHKWRGWPSSWPGRFDRRPLFQPSKTRSRR